MKNHFLILLILIPFGSWTQRNTGVEFHASVNHPLATSTFFGDGIGVNALLRDTCIFNFKLGAEMNYFHTYDGSAYDGKMSSAKDVHYRYVIVSFPVFIRLTFGERFKWFLETGAYLGICAGGNRRYTSTSYGPSPGNISEAAYSQYYGTGLSITPAAGLGVRFPLSRHVDLFLKPEFAFMKSNLGATRHKNTYGPGDHTDFNNWYTYVRFCAGIHLKPKK